MSGKTENDQLIKALTDKIDMVTSPSQTPKSNALKRKREDDVHSHLRHQATKPEENEPPKTE